MTGQQLINADILVAGPGPAGLTAAIGLAMAGYSVALVGEPALQQGTRTVALFEGSLRFLASLGVREQAEASGAPLAVMRISDDTGSPFRRPPVDFRASEIGVEYFGYNVENHVLTGLLLERAMEFPHIRLLPSPVSAYAFAPDAPAQAVLADGTRIETLLVIGADGARSPARKAGGITAQTWDYGQTAITGVLGHDRDHRQVSTEFHTRWGPCTFVPMPPQAGAPHASSLVWLMQHAEARRRAALDPEALAIEIEDAAHFGLGQMRLLRPINLYPIRGLAARRLVADRLALTGEAAHVFPPIGAQGLNLGFRDSAHLVEVLSPRLDDPGAPDVLRDYAARRAPDIASRTMGVDILNRALLTHILPMDMLRGAGVMALANIGPLRRRIMQEGMSPQRGAPQVMRNGAEIGRTGRETAANA